MEYDGIFDKTLKRIIVVLSIIFVYVALTTPVKFHKHKGVEQNTTVCN